MRTTRRLLPKHEKRKCSLQRFPEENKGADVNLVDAYDTTAFLYACAHGTKGLVKKLLPMVTDINYQNMKGESALYNAFQKRKFDVAQVLIERGADVNLLGPLGTTALLQACNYGKIHLVKKILPSVKDINYRNKNEGGALHLALKIGYFDLANVLINKGADVNLANSSGTKALFYACKLGKIELVKKILPKVADLNLQRGGESALHVALLNQNFDAAHALVDEGADVNLIDVSNMTAFHYGCKFGNDDLVKRMLPMVANINLQDDAGKTALHLTFEPLNLEIALVLIDEGADDSSAFLYACGCDQFELVKRMLPMVTNLNCRNKWGQSALHVLLSNARYVYGKYSFQCKLQILQILVKNGVNINLQDNCGNTALHLVCSVGNDFSDQVMAFCSAAALFLVKKPGIELNLKNHRGQIPLDFARGNQKIDPKVLRVLETRFDSSNK